MPIEVLSPSTMRFDRLTKVEEHKAHPSVRVIMLVASEAASIIACRRMENTWEATVVEGLERMIPLPEIEAELTMADVYEDTGLVASG